MDFSGNPVIKTVLPLQMAWELLPRKILHATQHGKKYIYIGNILVFFPHSSKHKQSLRSGLRVIQGPTIWWGQSGYESSSLLIPGVTPVSGSTLGSFTIPFLLYWDNPGLIWPSNFKFPNLVSWQVLLSPRCEGENYIACDCMSNLHNKIFN